MINNQFDSLYEDSDDMINASLKVVKPCLQETIHGQKRRCENEEHLDVPGLETDASSDDSEGDDGVFDRNCNRLKRLKRQREHRVPDCIAKQSMFVKSDLANAVSVMRSLSCITGRSFKDSRMDFSVGLPVLVFFFTPSQIGSLKFFEQLNELNNVSIVGVTPDFPYRNEYGFPIMLDRSGALAKIMRVRDPLGGGVYPIPSVLIFDRQGGEVVRIQLGYDYGVYYDSSVENNLQTVLIDCINYTNTL